MTNKTYTPGQIVTLAGIEFVILDDFGDSGDGGHDLFVLALESLGQSTFGDTNNYAESKLKEAVDDWLEELTSALDEEFGCDRPRIKNRVIDLTTLDGYKGFGSLEVTAAPLTLDEARKYAEVMPDPEVASWLATGWGGLGQFGFMDALTVCFNGKWDRDHCSISYGVRPALVIPSSLLDEPDAREDKPDLSEYSTDELLAEVRRRMELQ